MQRFVMRSCSGTPVQIDKLTSTLFGLIHLDTEQCTCTHHQREG